MVSIFIHICIFFSWTRDFWQNSTENSICFHDHPGESHWYHFRSHSNGGLHSNFLIGIANIDSLPTVTMILSISLSLPCPISRSQVFTLQNYDKRKPASTTWRLFLIFCLSSRWLPKKDTEIPCIMFTRIYRICLHVKSLSPFNLRDLGRGNNIFKLLVAAGLSWVHTENEYSYDVTFCSWRFSSYSCYSLLSWKMEKNNR